VGRKFTIPADYEHLPYLEEVGVEFPDEFRNPDGSYSVTLGDLRDTLKGRRDEFTYEFVQDNAITSRLELVDGEFGEQLVEDVDYWARAIEREFGFRNPEDWDNDFEYVDGATLGDLKASFREGFREAITVNDYFTPDMYQQEYERSFGPLDWEPPTPPSLSQAEGVITPSLGITAVDGDTIQMYTEDGHVDVRLIGVNAPELGQPGSAEAETALHNFLTKHEGRVRFVLHQPELFGRTQTFRDFDQGEVIETTRLFAWLYVDGQPIYDPTVFTADNPRGVGISGDVPDFEAMLSGRGVQQ